MPAHQRFVEVLKPIMETRPDGELDVVTMDRTWGIETSG
jgi:hypothetical protein